MKLYTNDLGNMTKTVTKVKFGFRAFVWEKWEIVVILDLKVNRCIELNEKMKLHGSDLSSLSYVPMI